MKNSKKHAPELACGFFTSHSGGGGYWGVYPISARTERGTVGEKHVISAHASSYRAQVWIDARAFLDGER